MRERYFMEVSSYRPRNSGHDYYGRGTYLVTLVVSGRERLLSRFVTNAGSKDLAGREHLDSDYSRFHNLNTLAAEICAFDGEAKIIADKTS